MTKPKVKLLSAQQLDNINPGIRDTVQWLRSHGFDTVDSGDGKTHEYECDLPFPYVHIAVDPSEIENESKRLHQLLVKSGVNFDRGGINGQDFSSNEELAEHLSAFPSIEANYSPLDEFASISIYNVVIELPRLTSL